MLSLIYTNKRYDKIFQSFDILIDIYVYKYIYNYTGIGIERKDRTLLVTVITKSVVCTTKFIYNIWTKLDKVL